MLLVHLN